MKDFVSIIIPTFNREHLLRETLNSVWQQTHENWECIVVDDGSTDGTAQLVRSYVERDNRFVYCKRPKDRPKGANACRNFGFELSKGEFINWFDDDDVMLSGFLQNRLNSFSETIQFVICPGIFSDKDLNRGKTMYINPAFDLFKGIIFWHQQIITNSVLFRKSFLEGKELFKEGFPKSQELEFFTRIFFKIPKKNYAFLNTPLFLYRQHEESKTAKSHIYNPEYKEADAFIDLNNLQKSIEIKDGPLVKFHLQRLFTLIMEALLVKDEKTLEFIITKIKNILKFHSKPSYRKFKVYLFFQKKTNIIPFLKWGLNPVVISLNKSLNKPVQ